MIVYRANYGEISIHAPRAGSDLSGGGVNTLHLNFNPCSPCGERRGFESLDNTSIQFQSMLPVRGATFDRGFVSYEDVFQSMLPVRGATPSSLTKTIRKGISIHAPRAGSDQFMQAHKPVHEYFNPCSPCGERRQNQTKYGLYFGKIAEVSDRQQQRFGMYEVKHERLERLQGHFEKFRGANGRRIF